MIMEESPTPPIPAAPRLRCADREREDPLPRRIDDLIDADHRARIIWLFVSGLDLSALDQQVTLHLASLMQQGLVEVSRVAQDGVRVRASAGATSFRRGETLQAGLGTRSVRTEAPMGVASDFISAMSRS